MTKLFISYRSLDSAKVDMIVTRLRSLKNDNGTPRYDIWQDKTSIPVGQDWWQAIVQGIIDCDVFVFMISHESVKNINCRAELSYARKRNRPIIPLVLEGEFAFNPVTGKNDVSYWGDMPDEMNDTRAQFLFYEGTSFVNQLNEAVDRLMSLNLRDIPAPEPPDPRNANDATNDTTLIYDRACDYAWRMEFATAEKLFQRLIGWNDELFADDAHDWIVLLRQYQRMVKLDARESVRYKIPKLWEKYVEQFPKPFVAMFDPKGIGDRYIQDSQTNTVSLSHSPPVQQPTKSPPKPTKPQVMTLEQSAASVRKIIGDPFDWCEVPAGKFTYGLDDTERKLDLPAFAMAKYPITYSQFQVFIDDKDGFHDKRWWVGLAQDQSVKPGDQRFKIADHPCERVSWYDAMAFCRWLSFRVGGGYDINDITSWAVRLPTEFEWEKAARGTDGRIYPYGNKFDKNKSNTRDSGIKETTPVTQYPQGESPYGVFDMSGNVWDWCLSHYSNPILDVKGENISFSSLRVLRGGSWFSLNLDARAVNRDYFNPLTRNDYLGFRLCRPGG